MKSLPDQLIVYSGMMDSLLRDIHAGTTCSLSVDRDRKTVANRVSNEGLYFLTTVLPSLGKAVDRALETKHLSLPLGFKTYKKTCLPCFLQDKFRCVFDTDGTLLDQPCPYSIQEIRQVCFLFYKLELPFTDDQVEAALSSFEKAESDLRSHSFGSCDRKIIYEARLLLTRLFDGYDPKDIVPGHGPGSVNTGEKGNQKWTFKRIYLGSHECYPFYDYFMVNKKGEVHDRISWYRNLSREEHSHSKVCLVPKDSRGPRVISVEPLEIQYLQQGQMRSLVRWIERSPLTRGQVNFTDQTINQRLALSSSIDREYATVDLKEASDRVHVNLVRLLFPESLVEHLFATRSRGTILPNGRMLEFRKFAPMGSATCFPVLALTVWALTRAYLNAYGRGGSCFVYGDDLIVPTDQLAGVCLMLESFALRVNRDKTFSLGSFRESCGIDAFKGVDVSPLRLRRPWSAKRTDSSVYHHYISLANNMFRRGNWATSKFIQDTCSKLWGVIPYGTEKSGFPCLELSDPAEAERLNCLLLKRSRWNGDYQRLEFRVWAYKPDSDPSPIDSWQRLLKGLIAPEIGSMQLQGPVPEPSVVSRRVRKLSNRWMPV